MVDDQHESEAEETRPSVDEALSDAAGDVAKTPSEDDPTSGGATGADTTGTSGGDDAVDDAASDTTKTPGAADDAL